MVLHAALRLVLCDVRSTREFLPQICVSLHLYENIFSQFEKILAYLYLHYSRIAYLCTSRLERFVCSFSLLREEAASTMLCWHLLTGSLILQLAFSMTTKSYSYKDLDGLVQRVLGQRSEERQVFIGVGGGPGSGKSTIAEKVCDELNAKGVKSVVLPMDGYHISQKELARMGERGEIIGDPDDTTGESTTLSDLMRRRGAPWTFDASSFVRDVSKAKEKGEGSFPIYSREISDPVPDGAVLTKETQVVFCEGLYLLAFGSEDWAPLKDVWDDCWYIYVPQEIVEERLVTRHLKNWNERKIKDWGEGREGAVKKTEANDMKNSRWVEAMSKPYAFVIVNNYEDDEFPDKQ